MVTDPRQAFASSYADTASLHVAAAAAGWSLSTATAELRHPETRSAIKAEVAERVGLVSLLTPDFIRVQLWQILLNGELRTTDRINAAKLLLLTADNSGDPETVSDGVQKIISALSGTRQPKEDTQPMALTDSGVSINDSAFEQQVKDYVAAAYQDRRPIHMLTMFEELGYRRQRETILFSADHLRKSHFRQSKMKVQGHPGRRTMWVPEYAEA